MFKKLGQIAILAGWGLGSYLTKGHTTGEGIMNVLNENQVPQQLYQLLDSTQSNPDLTTNPVVDNLTQQLQAEKLKSDALEKQVELLSTQVIQLVDALNKK